MKHTHLETRPAHQVVVATEAKFTRGPDGVIRSDTGGRGYPFWTRYLAVFDRVVVLARVVEATHNGGHPVCGPGVDVRMVVGYSGLRELVPALRRVRAQVRAVCAEPDSAYIARLPGIVGGLMILQLRRSHVPFALEVLGDPYEVFGSDILPAPVTSLMQVLSLRQMRRQCGHAGAVAYVTRSTLQQRYPASSNAVTTHYSSVDLPEAAFVTDPAPASQSVPVIITVGTQAQMYKGHDVLIEAVGLMRDRGNRADLRLIGDGRHRRTLEELSDRLRLNDRVTFVGQLASGAAIRAELDQSDLFVHPSRTEGLPRALLEAMARGMPCVASNVGGIPELLPEEDMVPPDQPSALADKLEAVLAEPNRLQAMAVRNLTEARTYSEPTLALRRAAFYQAVSGLVASPPHCVAQHGNRHDHSADVSSGHPRSWLRLTVDRCRRGAHLSSTGRDRRTALSTGSRNPSSHQ